MLVVIYLIGVALFYGILSATAQPDPSSESWLSLARRIVKQRPVM